MIVWNSATNIIHHHPLCQVFWQLFFQLFYNALSIIGLWEDKMAMNNNEWQRAKALNTARAGLANS